MTELKTLLAEELIIGKEVCLRFLRINRRAINASACAAKRQAGRRQR